MYYISPTAAVSMNIKPHLSSLCSPEFRIDTVCIIISSHDRKIGDKQEQGQENDIKKGTEGVYGHVRYQPYLPILHILPRFFRLVFCAGGHPRLAHTHCLGFLIVLLESIKVPTN